MVMSGRRMSLAREFLGEAKVQETSTNICFSGDDGWRQGDVRIQCAQRRIIELLGVRVKPIEAMCPSADDNNLIEPWSEGGD